MYVDLKLFFEISCIFFFVHVHWGEVDLWNYLNLSKG